VFSLLHLRACYEAVPHPTSGNVSYCGLPPAIPALKLLTRSVACIGFCTDGSQHHLCWRLLDICVRMALRGTFGQQGAATSSATLQLFLLQCCNVGYKSPIQTMVVPTAIARVNASSPVTSMPVKEIILKKIHIYTGIYNKQKARSPTSA
jgi:hypothetical protein